MSCFNGTFNTIRVDNELDKTIDRRNEVDINKGIKRRNVICQHNW